MLVIGCGNEQRGDDAAGILVARQLSSQGIPAEESAADLTNLVDQWRGAEEVILVDSVITGAPVGTIHVWDANMPFRSSKRLGSTHGFGVREAVEMARAMNCLPSRLRIFGIEGGNFALGSELSPEVQRSIAALVERIATESKAAG